MIHVSAYRVRCYRYGEPVQFYISLRSIKNNDNICSHCPVRHKCNMRIDERVHFYEDIRANIDRKLPIGVEL